jgi:TonB family protein
VLEFRKRGIQILKDSSEKKRKAACFLFSVVFHGLLVYVLFQSKVSVNINLVQLEIREVALITPEQLFIPENLEALTKGIREEELRAEGRISGKANEDERAKEEPGGGQLDAKSGIRQGLYPPIDEDVRASKGTDAFLSNIASVFRLGGFFKSESDLPTDYVLDLSLDFGRSQKLLDEAERIMLESNIRQLKFPRSGFFNIGFSKGPTGVPNYGPGGGGQKARASFRVEDYDIAPWAEQVVNTILLNWDIPYPQELGIKGVVGISVVIQKNGELYSARVVSSSLVLLLDEAALEALRKSAPFPPLPGDFHLERFEAYFEFHYGD